MAWNIERQFESKPMDTAKWKVSNRKLEVQSKWKGILLNIPSRSWIHEIRVLKDAIENLDRSAIATQTYHRLFGTAQTPANKAIAKRVDAGARLRDNDIMPQFVLL